MEQLYAVILGTQDVNGRKGYSFATVNPDTLQVKHNGVFDEATLVKNLNQNYNLINFGIENGRLVERCGSFSRLEAKDGVQPQIVIQELATANGAIKGYRLLNPANGKILSLRKEDILARQEKCKVPLLQNGIIRGNKINCYPNSPFPRYTIGATPRNTLKKPSIGSKVKETSNDFLSKFTPEQKKELASAKKEGIDLRLIANPNLSPEQMRVLWVAKKKGAYSEYFARPEYSVEVMKFYADRLVTVKTAKDCADLLAKPDYDVDKLTELYLAVCEGVDYSSFINASTAEEMYIQREKLRSAFWDDVASLMDEDYINSGIKFAKKIKSKE